MDNLFIKVNLILQESFRYIHMKHFCLAFTFFLNLTVVCQSDQVDRDFLNRIFEEAYTNGQAMYYLNELCSKTPNRLSGSIGAKKAIELTSKMLDDIDQIDVFKQAVLVPHWERISESAQLISSNGESQEIAVCALGGSISTPEGGIEAELVEVQNFGQLKKLGKKQIAGKIVFFNRPMNPIHLSTFTAYSGSVDQRWAGAMKAAEYGAKAVLVRSLSLRKDNFPHTGSMAYQDGIEKIPAAAISTIAAELLHQKIQLDPKTKVKLNLECITHPDAHSHNVIGEWKGAEKPSEYIIVGGHLDAWDLGQGAHDDGAGIAHSIEALRLLNKLGYKPRHSLRAVLFMNEENGLRGGKEYAKVVKNKNETHLAALESDRGGFMPKGFRYEGPEDLVNWFSSQIQSLHEFGMYDNKVGGAGADIGQLDKDKTLLIGLVPESSRYFDFHHASSDKLEAVNERELETGAAILAAIIYLLDQHIDSVQ